MGLATTLFPNPRSKGMNIHNSEMKTGAPLEKLDAYKSANLAAHGDQR